MRKAAILCLTAFYLLLTTGTFVCIVHCAVENLVERSGNHTAKNAAAGRDDKCKGDKGCDCCKKHDNFTIKENIRPAHNSHDFCTLVLVYHQFSPSLNLPEYITYKSYLPDCHAPPAKSGKLISITQRSLQI
jgi:hypothetical protein